MQAGDQLKFIKPFEGIERPSSSEINPISDDDAEVLSLLLHRFIGRNAENIHEFSVLEDSGLVSMFESSYRLDMPDKSYLHILAFGSSDENGLIDFGITVNEHFESGHLAGGYMYLCQPEDGLTRSAFKGDEVVDLDDDDDISAHFTLSSQYSIQDEYRSMAASEDPETQAYAAEIKSHFELGEQFEQIMKETGFDNLPPPPGELAMIMELVWDAKPFPLHRNS